ncbi:unnamed protein product [Miscanthus lutarioriparius]|uniref:Uncharacterized protein n=1 Tax=Miscanthus lutarioriparius TaxID=422564 RepID=A0A811RLP2_9POAL|nr:unnamed protein product [Miscanthus lutarioriparius]
MESFAPYLTTPNILQQITQRIDNYTDKYVVLAHPSSLSMSKSLIKHISHVNVKALSGALEKLESLRTLILEDGSESFCLPNLIMLSLEKTYVTQEFISKLSELPFLATLALYPGSYKDKKLVFASSKFPRLKKIKMIDVEVLEIVEVEVSMVPELKELEIHSPFTGCYHNIDLGNDKKRSQKTRI